MRVRHNLLRQTLGADLSDVDVTVTFAAALQEGGVDIPGVSSPDYLPLTIEDEIVYLVDYVSGALVGDITRGEEGTVAATHLTGASVRNSPTKLDFGMRQTLGPWEQDNVAASQAAVALNLAGAARSEVPMIRGGSITGIVVYSNDPRTAGTLTVDATQNGFVTGAQAILDAVNTVLDFETFTAGAIRFDAGDRIGVKITTDAGWLPITADITVVVEVTLDEVT